MSTQVTPSRLDPTKDFSSLVPSAYAKANAAFEAANAAFGAANNSTDVWVRIQANNAYDTANSGATFANASFLVANSAASFANGAFVTANASYDSQNTTASFANGAFVTANASYTAQNTTASFANGAFDRANAAYNAANNTGSITDSWARLQANAAYNAANTSKYITMNQPGSITPPLTGTARYYPKSNITVSNVYAYLGTSSSTNFTFNLYKNGSNAGLFLVNSNANIMSAVSCNIAMTTSDYFTINIVSGTGATDLKVDLQYS